jgi:hypothetical protein
MICGLYEAVLTPTTYQTSDGSYITIEPWMAEQYPGDITAGELAFTAVGLATTGAAPTLIEGAVGILWPAVAAAGADGDPTNEVQAIRTGATTVYQYVENGITRYIGITNNMPRRAAEHLVGKGWRIEPLAGLDKLSRTDARAVEQVLIEYYGLENLYNRINSIASTNEIYAAALQRGLEILTVTGFFR